MVLGNDCFSKDVPLCYYEISHQLYCMSTVNEDLNLCRFKCVFAYKVAPYFILRLLKISKNIYDILAHLSQRLIGELILKRIDYPKQLSGPPSFF